MSTETVKGRLSPEQVKHFREEGYLIYRDPVLKPEQFAGLKSHFEAELLKLPPDIRPEAMDAPHFMDTALFQWIFSDEVLNLVEPLLGYDVALFSSHFICKPKGNGKRVPWHEDSHYWKGWLNPMEVVTVWLAIDPSTKQNGCMNVIPRTHGHGYSDYQDVDIKHNVFSDEIIKEQRDDRRAVAIELQPNQASLHDGRIQHGSEPNTSAIRRCGYTMRFISTRTKFDQTVGKLHQIYLARGRDYAGNAYADPKKTYPELDAQRKQLWKNSH